MIYNINPIQIIYESLNNYDNDESSIFNLLKNNDTKVKSIRDISGELLKLKLNSPKEIKLAGMIENGKTIGDLIQKSPLNRDDTLRFLFFMRLSDLVDIEIDNSENHLREKNTTAGSNKQSFDKTDRMTSEEIQQYKTLTEKD